MTAQKPDKREIHRIAIAIKDAWDECGDVPFPLYDHEAEDLAKAAIAAMRALGQEDKG
jgi:hypothetical protein